MLWEFFRFKSLPLFLRVKQEKFKSKFYILQLIKAPETRFLACLEYFSVSQAALLLESLLAPRPLQV